jgi:hypothetical protein
MNSLQWSSLQFEMGNAAHFHFEATGWSDGYSYVLGVA